MQAINNKIFLAYGYFETNKKKTTAERPAWSLVPGVPKKYQRLISHRAKFFCLIPRISFTLNNADLNLDFRIKIVELC